MAAKPHISLKPYFLYNDFCFIPIPHLEATPGCFAQLNGRLAFGVLASRQLINPLSQLCLGVGQDGVTAGGSAVPLLPAIKAFVPPCTTDAAIKLIRIDSQRVSAA